MSSHPNKQQRQMDEPKPLDSLFKEKLFRIPDYQRGYAWGREQLDAFWEDLVNLPAGRSHYTGVLTLKETPTTQVDEDAKEFWLVNDHSYKLYHVVDGQQRLTTFIIFLQSFVDVVRALPENQGKSHEEIYVSETLSVASVQAKFLFKLKPPGDQFRTYKFGYTVDNPSYEYMRYRILEEVGGGTVFETFYTLNLSNAKRFFTEQLRSCYADEGLAGIQNLYRTLTKRFLFNEYIIKDEFDVFVAFETMNNRGKKLSDLELLKNRLIYLTTLYPDDELDPADRAELRDLINGAWKEVYYQLGRNKSKPLNDDDFLKAHWTMYFKYSRKTGRDYIKFLLEEQFTPQNVHKKVVHEVELEEAEEQFAESESDADEESEQQEPTAASQKRKAKLRPNEIRNYVKSLKESSVHWFASFYPEFLHDISAKERDWIQRLNRLGMSYFRPLVMAILKNIDEASERVRIFKEIERFIFVLFRLTQTRSNYRSSEFNNAVRGIDRGELDLNQLKDQLHFSMSFVTEAADGSFWIDDFYNLLSKKFDSGVGYYGWSGLKYFLYEYELSLLSQARQKKVDWSDLLKTAKDKVTIEHIYPQTESAEWKAAFKGIRKKKRDQYQNSLGNLLLLSAAINSSLQNDSFDAKRAPKLSSDGVKLRNGYSDGSHSEIEVSQCETWGPAEIRERGLRLLRFLEKRWNIKFADDAAREQLLFLPLLDSDEEEES